MFLFPKVGYVIVPWRAFYLTKTNPPDPDAFDNFPLRGGTIAELGFLGLSPPNANLLGSRITSRWHLKIDGLFGDVFPFSKQGMFRFQPIRPWKFTKEGLVQMIFLFKPVNFSGSKAVNFPGCRFRMSWEAHHQLVGVFIIPRGQQKN